MESKPESVEYFETVIMNLAGEAPSVVMRAAGDKLKDPTLHAHIHQLQVACVQVSQWYRDCLGIIQTMDRQGVEPQPENVTEFPGGSGAN